ncbi:HAMP domain-containing histidine kinase [Lysinibacillus agricola]|uniref:histidine kinase n=1 Tax=Lysinibacillus agricola TaxID=2590012 RepID=A0ABX7AVY6_9BACI|nr:MULTISPECIES: HAMP domain-containing sensor histidine kinase [Lysinibacillus]KOS62945.1 histidine kinase [Lysinibacillus sp. FJAT-14222]QQP13915.1 HAMP domain-containing histidine kinase [Lysinibacillus agricola]
MRKIIKPFKYLLSKLKILIINAITKVRQSIRIQLLTTFILCAFLGLLVARVTLPFLENINETVTIDYSGGMQQINFQAQRAADLAVSENSIEALQQMIEDENLKMEMKQSALKVLVTDERGKVLYKTKQAEEEQIDLHNKIRHVMDFAINNPFYNYDIPQVEDSRQEFIAFYPLTIEDKGLYLFVSGIPKGAVISQKKKGPIPPLMGIAFFTFSFFYITKRKMKQIEALAKGVKEIAKGDLTYRIEKKGKDEIALLTENVNHMAEAIMASIEMERRIDKQKNELITNVSHDLRTPLTSIMGYLRLLRDEKYETKEQYDEYIKIAFSKSEQLKNLIDDLFEYTKLTNESNVLAQHQVCLNELLDQLIEELIPQAEENHRTFIKNFSEERIFATVDSEKIVRVFDNLLMNAIKYSTDKGEIFVSLERKERYVQICVANESNEFTSEELMSLFERFYKKDQSRTSVAEGSGLGLAIAKSIVELHGGKIEAKYADGLLQFIIMLPVIAAE